MLLSCFPSVVSTLTQIILRLTASYYGKEKKRKKEKEEKASIPES